MKNPFRTTRTDKELVHDALVKKLRGDEIAIDKLDRLLREKASATNLRPGDTFTFSFSFAVDVPPNMTLPHMRDLIEHIEFK